MEIDSLESDSRNETKFQMKEFDSSADVSGVIIIRLMTNTTLQTTNNKRKKQQQQQEKRTIQE